MSDHSVSDSSGPSGAWRVGDRDRDGAVEALSEHYAVGRLDKEEYDERTDRAYAARTAADLAALFTDLPGPHGAAADEVAPRAAELPRARHHHRHHHPAARRHHHRGPFGPWLLLVIPIVVLTGAYWLIWLVPVLLWCVVRPARRHHHGRGAQISGRPLLERGSSA